MAVKRMKPTHQETVSELEKIEAECIDYHKHSDYYFSLIEGNIPILISAPHAAEHFRNGQWKEEDEYT